MQRLERSFPVIWLRNGFSPPRRTCLPEPGRSALFPHSFRRGGFRAAPAFFFRAALAGEVFFFPAFFAAVFIQDGLKIPRYRFVYLVEGRIFLRPIDAHPPAFAVGTNAGGVNLAADFNTDGFLDNGDMIPVPTFSSGVSLYKPGETATAFIERADKALYRAKRLGRNRVELHRKTA